MPKTKKVDAENGEAKSFVYIFDFGVEFRFACRVLRESSEDVSEATVIRSVGDAPAQYDEWDEEYDEDEDDEDDEEDDDEEDDEEDGEGK